MRVEFMCVVHIGRSERREGRRKSMMAMESLCAIENALSSAISQVTATSQESQKTETFVKSKFKLAKTRTCGTPTAKAADLTLIPRIIHSGATSSRHGLVPLCRLTNSAYKDARWFKQPHFHDRVSLDVRRSRLMRWICSHFPQY